MKKIYGVFKCILVCALVVCFISGCSNSSNKSNPSGTLNPSSSNKENPDDETKKLVKLVLVDEMANYAGKQQGWFGWLLAERCGIELEIISPNQVTKETKADIWKNNISNDFDAKLFNPKKDALDLKSDTLKENLKIIAPGIYEIVEDRKDTFSIPTHINTDKKSHTEFINTWNMRYDLYKEAGKPQIKTLDDLYKAFVAMQKKSDEKVKAVYLSGTEDDNSYTLSGAAGITKAYYGVDIADDKVIFPDTGKSIGLFEEDSPYLKVLKWYNKIYKSGLLDYDKGKKSADKILEKLQAGSILLEGNADYIVNQGVQAGENCQKYLPVIPEEATNLAYSTYDISNDNENIYIDKDSENITKVLEFLEYLYSSDGYMEMVNGPKGLMWDTDENGAPYNTDEGKKYLIDSTAALPDEYTKYNDDKEGYATFMEGSFQFSIVPYFNYKLKEYDNEFVYSSQWKSNNDFIILYNNFAQNETKELSDTRKEWIEDTGYTDVQEYMESFKYNIVNSQKHVKKEKDISKEYIEKAWDVILSDNYSQRQK